MLQLKTPKRSPSSCKILNVSTSFKKQANQDLTTLQSLFQRKTNMPRKKLEFIMFMQTSLCLVQKRSSGTTILTKWPLSLISSPTNSFQKALIATCSCTRTEESKIKCFPLTSVCRTSSTSSQNILLLSQRRPTKSLVSKIKHFGTSA